MHDDDGVVFLAKVNGQRFCGRCLRALIERFSTTQSVDGSPIQLESWIQLQDLGVKTGRCDETLFDLKMKEQCKQISMPKSHGPRAPVPENDTRQLCNLIMATETLTLFGRKTINPGLGCWRCVKIAQEVLGVPQSRFH